MTNDIRKYMNLMESEPIPRDSTGRVTSPDIQYTATPEKVVAQLKSYDSQSYTKLAQKIERISVLEAEMKTLKADVKQLGREKVADLFAADDVVRTRVVETCSFIFTLTKDPKPTETYSYAKILGELEESLTPELIKVLSSLKEKYKSVTQKEPALSIKPVATEESLNEGFWDTMREKLSKFFGAVKNWAGKFDAKLESLKAQAALGESINSLSANIDSDWQAPVVESPWKAFAEAKQDERNSCTECGKKIDSDDYHICDACAEKKDGDKSLEEQLNVAMNEYGSDPYNKVGKDFQTRKPTAYDAAVSGSSEPKSMNEPALISTWKTHDGSNVYIWRSVQNGKEKISMVDSRGKQIPWHREPTSYSDAVKMLRGDYEYQQVANQKELSLEASDEFENDQGLTEDEDDRYPIPSTLDDEEIANYLSYWNKFGKFADASSEEGQALLKFGDELTKEAAMRGLV